MVFRFHVNFPEYICLCSFLLAGIFLVHLVKPSYHSQEIPCRLKEGEQETLRVEARGHGEESPLRSGGVIGGSCEGTSGEEGIHWKYKNQD